MVRSPAAPSPIPFSWFPVRGDDGARAVGATDDDVGGRRRGATYGVIDNDRQKFRSTGINPSIARDVSGEGVQQALLKIVEGVSGSLARRRHRTDTLAALRLLAATALPIACDRQQMITQSLFFPRKQGDFQEKQGGDWAPTGNHWEGLGT